MRGRKPKPTSLRLLNGLAGHRPINPDEPKPPRVIPRCPAHLNKEARREWKRMVADLSPLFMLTPLDRVALAVICDAWARFVEASMGLQKSGILVRGRHSKEPVHSPYLAVINQAIAQITAMLPEFGLTPSSRSRLRIEKPAEKSDFMKLLDSKS